MRKLLKPQQIRSEKGRFWRSKWNLERRAKKNERKGREYSGNFCSDVHRDAQDLPLARLKSRQEKEKVPAQMPFITLYNDADARVYVEIWKVMNHVFGQGLLESRLDFQWVSSQNHQMLMYAEQRCQDCICDGYSYLIKYFFSFTDILSLNVPPFEQRTQGNRSTIEHDTTAHEIYTIFTLHLSHSPKSLGRHWIAVSIREYAYRHIIYSTKPWKKKHAVSSGDYDSFKKRALHTSNSNRQNNTCSRICTVHVYDYSLIGSKWQRRKNWT